MQLLRRGISADLPMQFRLLVGGSLLTATGFTMAFPFLTLYLSTKLGIGMDRIGLLFLANSAAGFVAQMVAGPVADRFGRKPVMVSGLLLESCVAFGFTQANTFEEFVALSTLHGFFGSLFQPASSAMVVDLVGPKRRAEAFGIIRVAANLGWVIGPSLGGLLATQSYTMLFLGAAVSQFIYMVVLLIFAKETLPSRGTADSEETRGGYGFLFRDTSFLVLLIASILTALVYTQLNTTMPVYLKRDRGIPESGYGMMMAINAGMVVLFQFPITRMLERRDRVYMLALGALLYAVGLGSLGLWRDLPLFSASVVILTVGEMFIAPVSSALVADLAPSHMRARYMAAFGLTWTIGFGLGPMWGGAVLERWGSGWLWSCTFLIGCVAALAYLPLKRTWHPRLRGTLRSNHGDTEYTEKTRS